MPRVSPGTRRITSSPGIAAVVRNIPGKKRRELLMRSAGPSPKAPRRSSWESDHLFALHAFSKLSPQRRWSRPDGTCAGVKDGLPPPPRAYVLCRNTANTRDVQKCHLDKRLGCGWLLVGESLCYSASRSPPSQHGSRIRSIVNDAKSRPRDILPCYHDDDHDNEPTCSPPCPCRAVVLHFSARGVGTKACSTCSRAWLSCRLR